MKQNQLFNDVYYGNTENVLQIVNFIYSSKESITLKEIMTEVLIVRLDKDRMAVINSLVEVMGVGKSEAARRCIDFMEIIGNRKATLQELVDFDRLRGEGLGKDDIFEIAFMDIIRPIEEIRKEWGLVHVS